MKRFLFMVAMVLTLSACDNTKMQLRAPAKDKASASTAIAKTDTVKTDTVDTDTITAVGKR